MSFSNPKQHNHPKNPNPSERTPKGHRADYPEGQGSFVKKAQKNQNEASYHRKSAQDDLENSQNYHKPARAKQNRGNYDDMRNYDEGNQNGNRRQNYKQGAPRGNQEQGQYYAKKGENQHEGGYTQEREAEDLNGKKNKNGGRKQDRERKDKNKEKFEDSYDTVYYVKKPQNQSQQPKSEEEKRGDDIKGQGSQEKVETATKTEAVENKADIISQLEAQALSILAQIQPNRKPINGAPRVTSSDIKTPDQLLNKPDRVSLTVSKPVIEIPAPSDTQSVTGNNQSIQDDKDTISVISDTDTTHSKQAASIPQYPQPQIMSPILNYPQVPASAEQQRVMFAPGFQQIPVFHAPYIVFPQPNGTSIIQPLYQMPGMNMVPRRSEEQPMYLVPSTLVPTPENAENRQRTEKQEALPAQFFGGFPMNAQFLPYAQMHPGFMTMTSPIVTQPVHQNISEKELQRSFTADSQSKEDNASDRRDD